MSTTGNEDRVIIIAGPTASGKSAVALQVAEHFQTEIISADSRQIYKLTDIGTAKPTGEELARVRHHFINYLPPDEVFNAGLFEKGAMDIIRSLHEQNRIPIVCGGTGLYIKALVDGIIDVEIAEDLHQHLMDELREHGNESMYAFLQKIDPLAAETMLPQNWKRVIRAIEIKLGTGSSILAHHQEQERSRNLRFLQFGLLWEREDLYERINSRVELMMQIGLLNEVLQLKNAGFSPANNALNTVGYKELFDYLDGRFSLEEAVRLIKRNTRHYAKRQMTWFRGDERITWIPAGNRSTDELASFISQSALMQPPRSR